MAAELKSRIEMDKKYLWRLEDIFPTDEAVEQEMAALSALLLDGEAQTKPVSELSGGMRRRVAIARALLAESELILMDEPFKGLDEGTRETVITYVKEMTVGRTVILVTHDEEDAAALSARVVRME